MNASIRNVHFIGICGTAMGAVAAAMQDHGFSVTGSDSNIYPPMSDFLHRKHIKLSEGFRPENLPDKVDLVVVGNVISRGNPELEAVLNRRLPYQSLPETLRHFFLRGKRNLVVAGTHGKTTTASLLTHILRAGKVNPSWMIGGIAEDLTQGAHFDPDSEYVVLEGDEYDTCFFDKGPKFAHYLPELVLLNTIELDQMDIYPDLEAVKRAFGLLLRVLPENGSLIFNADDAVAREVVASSRTITKIGVGTSKQATASISKPEFSPSGSCFTLFNTRFSLPLFGEFNIRNAGLAIAAARHCGIPLNVIESAVSGFRGVQRRQTLRGERNGIRIVEDFGKHPTNLRETLQALALRFPDARVWAAVDPRANTMCRKEIQAPLTEALSFAYGALIGPIDRPERFQPGQAMEPAALAADLTRMGHPSFAEPSVDAIVERLRQNAVAGDVIVAFSSGGFGGIYEKLLAM